MYNSQSAILYAWENLERVLKDEESATISRPLQTNTSKIFKEYSSRPRTAKTRPVTGVTRPMTGLTRLSSGGAIMETEKASMRKVFSIKVSSRPYKKHGFENIHVQKKSEFIEDDEKCTLIHSLDIESIIDLYASKCLDRGLEYQPEHALLFVEKFKQQCEHQLFICEDDQLGVQSAQTILNTLQYNYHFSQLRLARNNLGDDGLQVITELIRLNPSIIHLDVSSNSITPNGAYEFFTQLADIHSLISVDMSSKDGLNRNKVSVRGCEPLEMLLKYNHPLQFLNLRGASIQQCGFECILAGLASNNTLCVLNVAYNDLNAEACNYMSIHLVKSQLIDLDLSYNPLGNNGIDYFSNLFEKDTFQLKSLNLSGCGIKSLGILKFFTCVQKNRTLEKLILDDNQLSGNGFNQIENLLIGRTPISYLSLAKCQITSYGADYIGNGVERNKTLKVLILRDNEFGDIGGECIFKGVYFQRLDVRRCRLSDKSVGHLCNLIRNSASLNYLSIGDNSYHDSSGIMITEAVRSNSSLINFDVSENPLSYKFVSEINKIITQNKAKLEENKVPSYQNEVVRLKQFAKQKDQVDEQQEEIHNRRTVAEQKLEKAKKVKAEVAEDQTQKTMEIQEELANIQKQARQMDYDKNRYDQETFQMQMKWDDDYNNYMREIQETNGAIIRIEKELRQMKDQKQMRKQQIDMKLDHLRRGEMHENKILERAQLELKQLQERIRLMKDGPTSRRKTKIIQ